MRSVFELVRLMLYRFLSPSPVVSNLMHFTPLVTLYMKRVSTPNTNNSCTRILVVIVESKANFTISLKQILGVLPVLAKLEIFLLDFNQS